MSKEFSSRLAKSVNTFGELIFPESTINQNSKNMKKIKEIYFKWVSLNNKYRWLTYCAEKQVPRYSETHHDYCMRKQAEYEKMLKKQRASALQVFRMERMYKVLAD